MLPFFQLLPQINASLQVSNDFCEIGEVRHRAAPNTIFFLCNCYSMTFFLFAKEQRIYHINEIKLREIICSLVEYLYFNGKV